MLFHNLKLIYRQMLRSKVYSLLNIVGLSLGMVVATLIGLWVHDELTYNQYHSNYDQIFQVLNHQTGGDYKRTNTFLTTAAGPILAENFPNEIEEVFMIQGRAENQVLSFGEKRLREKGLFVQENGPRLLGFKMIAGTMTGLEDIRSILLSESFADRLFGDEDPMGKLVKLNGKYDFEVAGIYEDIPRNSRFSEADYAMRLDLVAGDMNAWSNFNVKVFAKVHPNANLEQVGNVLTEFVSPHYNSDKRQVKLFFHPMKDWHLRSEFRDFIPVMSDQMKFVWLYGIIGFFVLILACINFMNLSTARSEKRAKESGVRKAMGAIRKELIAQFYLESLLYAFSSALLALLLVALLLPWFNALSDKNITAPWGSPGFWLVSTGFVVLTGLLAGSYPAFHLSSFSPVKALKGKFIEGKRAAIPRKVLVVIQFTISIALMIGTITVNNQIQTAKSRPMGYEPDGLIALERGSSDFSKKLDVLKTALRQTGMAHAVGSSNYPIINNMGWNGGFSWQGMATGFDETFNTIRISKGYADAVGLEFVMGRDFSADFGNDNKAVLLNRSAMELMQLEDPIGLVVKYDPGWKEKAEYFTVVGVVEDMIKNSPFEKTDPSVMFLDTSWTEYLYIRLNPNVKASESIAGLQRAFHEVLPEDPFDYSFADEDYNRKFRSEQRISDQASLFSIVAIVISCLGLFGLASYLAEQRVKEIGIRKVLGASLVNILKLLSMEFVVLLVIAGVVAIPITYQVLNGWLEGYEVRTKLHWWIFALAGLGALFLTLLTSGFHALKAAMANPVTSLRSE